MQFPLNFLLLFQASFTSYHLIHSPPFASITFSFVGPLWHGDTVKRPSSKQALSWCQTPLSLAKTPPLERRKSKAPRSYSHRFIRVQRWMDLLIVRRSNNAKQHDETRSRLNQVSVQIPSCSDPSHQDSLETSNKNHTSPTSVISLSPLPWGFCHREDTFVYTCFNLILKP